MGRAGAPEERYTEGQESVMATAPGPGTTVTLDDVLAHTRQVLERVAAGDTLVVTRKSKPIVKMRPVRQDRVELRPVGLAAGTIAVPDDFDEPLPDDMIAAFSGQ
jgi:antitoxin (DNA-binding transcriptional repressor) of toxin-antitoxin stability system